MNKGFGLGKGAEVKSHSPKPELNVVNRIEISYLTSSSTFAKPLFADDDPLSYSDKYFDLKLQLEELFKRKIDLL